jgi:hypothetical protein
MGRNSNSNELHSYSRIEKIEVDVSMQTFYIVLQIYMSIFNIDF